VRQELKIARQMQKFAALAAKAGHTVELPKDIKAATAEVIAVRKTLPPLYEAEAVLLALEKPARFEYKICKREECKEPFGTNYRAVAYCSDNCRAKELAKIGIHWNPSKPPELRWGGEPPLIIPPSVVKLLRSLLSQLPPNEELIEHAPPEIPQEVVQNKTILPEPPLECIVQETPKEGSVFQFL
jgi:hypothetical protein